MSNIINYILENSTELIGIATAIVTAASAIAALTPTPTDDTWVGKAYRIVDWLALNIGRAKD
jgi:hypothetical protein|tara:strand:+ start:219 stop:404 length:186 start_codon:yes stop_codon:yes gene_type:complete